MTIIQLGSNRGYDGLTKWINNNPNINIDKLILVEPNVLHHESLEKCYKNIKNKVIDSSAIGLEEGGFDLFWCPKDGPLFEVSSLVKDHVIKHWGDSDIRSFKVKVKTLEQVLDFYRIKNIDWLLVDVEGLDAEIVLSFDWSKYNIKKVDIEHLHLGNKLNDVVNLFYKNGYSTTKAVDLYGYDIAFEKI
tara:strand:- start:7596 stop:8165 length:570 start_codon:yes stop_codon:yes gene_type:complete